MSTTTSHSTPGKIQYKFLSEEHGALRFRLSHLDVSVANAIRRTLLQDIPINVIRDVNFLVNTGRLTNEILAHRLSLVPVHTKHITGWAQDDATSPTDSWISKLPGRLELEVNVQADQDMRLITTEDFKLRVKGEEKRLLATTVSQQIFPKNAQTQSFIEFSRLRPKLGDNIPGEHLHFVAQFSVGTAKEDGAFNVVSKCAYQNTPVENLDEIWEKVKASASDDLAARKKDFMCLDAQRHFVPDSFDFVVESIGIYRNEELLHKACAVLGEKVLAFYDAVRDGKVLIRRSEAVSMEHCYDVTLEQEDYTLGNLLAHLLTESFYDVKDPDVVALTFCGFKKEHPHDENSTLRLAFAQDADDAVVQECLKKVCGLAHAIFERVGNFFGKE